MTKMTLNDMKPGEQAQIIHINGKGSTRRRILDMGMVPGANIKIIKRAPLGDPIEFKIKGYNLSLRKSEAELIMVKILEK